MKKEYDFQQTTAGSGFESGAGKTRVTIRLDDDALHVSSAG
jgi:hypothetical protein